MQFATIARFLASNSRCQIKSLDVGKIGAVLFNDPYEIIFDGGEAEVFLVRLVSSIVKGTDFYLTESNICIPHSALNGAAPEEIITGSWTEEKKMELKEKIIAVRQLRIETNKADRCSPCLA